MRRLLTFTAFLLLSCGANVEGVDAGAGGGAAGAGGGAAGGVSGAGGGTSLDDAGALDDAGTVDAGQSDGGRADAAVADAGSGSDAGAPRVDRSMPQLFQFQFRPSAAEPDAGRADATQLAALDTRVRPLGQLVVYLHGAGTPATCGSTTHNALLASFGYHVISPCYLSDYGVGNCGADIGGCRLEAFDGVDRTTVIDVRPAESITARIVRMLERLATLNPQGDWGWFLVNGAPRWEAIVISGISHGASTAGLIGLNRRVARVVMLSGPLDSNQAWLAGPSLTPRDAFWGFTHQRDPQHPGHLAAFTALQVPGSAVNVDVTPPPYGSSHRLFSNADAGDPHGSTQAGGSSPRLPDGGARFAPVWEALYRP
ncbi:MAG: hypothetical protein SFW67_36405 [Myxococcaceae bacterium]|nr:hypothetical protein [Myxococcaceae bacterium]